MEVTSLGIKFELFKPKKQTPFEKLFEIFKELILHTSGDFDEAIDWLRQLDKEYELTDSSYTIDDFIEDLKSKSLIQRIPNQNTDDDFKITAKTEKLIREHTFNQLFGNLTKSLKGNHKTKFAGTGTEHNDEFRPFQFGDNLDRIQVTESLKNAQIRSFGSDFNLQNEDLIVYDTLLNVQMSTVLMIDISHSMILYGEDRITPAKKVALALSQFIISNFPKDTLDIIVFGNDAKKIDLKDLPFLKVGPYHTNTVAGLELAMDILRKKKGNNKQVFMITDGKPSCLKLKDGSYYKNSVGLDQKVVDKCYTMAKRMQHAHIPITTFMIAQDSYLMEFIREFTAINQGKAYFTGLKNLGNMIFEDYQNNKKKKL